MEEKDNKAEGIRVELAIPPGVDLTEEQKAKLQAQLSSAAVEAISGARARAGATAAVKAEHSVKDVTSPETKISIPVPVPQKKETGIA
jgi:hypothetical protein